MRALMMAAGLGYRLGAGETAPPKSLLSFDGRSLLERHLGALAACGVDELIVGVGYRAEEIRLALEEIQSSLSVHTVYNPDFREGNVVTLWCLREHLSRGGSVVLMDADVLYDSRVLETLVASRHETCFLLDRELEPGDEPVKICVREERIVEFHKRVDPELGYDYHGESVGFFKLSEGHAVRLRETVERFVAGSRREALYEEALREMVLAESGAGFGFEDVTGLPWIEIDFPEDLARARDEILPQLVRVEAA